MNLAEQLSIGIAELNIEISTDAQKTLLDYLALLNKWNRIHNLTAVRDPEQMVSQHLLDSLSILSELNDCKCLIDVGSGGGLPGIPLAITRPDMAVTLLDSNHKKTAFLRQAKMELKLDNVDVVCERVEAWKGNRFDIVVSRAFADLVEFAELTRHLAKADGKFLAMKGIYPFEEISRLSDGFQLNKVVSLRVPQLDAERHLVVLHKAA